jgi:dTDP-4-amino-4,6-dideoxygalactose transaminase
MKSKGILSVFHYLPLHLSPMGRSMGYTQGMLPTTEKMSSRLLRLPLFYGLKNYEQEVVVNAIKDFF